MTIDFKLARLKMVDNQIRTTDVTSHLVLDAFLSVEREKFVPTKLKPLAYIDDDLDFRSSGRGGGPLPHGAIASGQASPTGGCKA